MNYIDLYIGGAWTEEHDCFWWFRKIQKEIFNKHVLPCLNLAEKRQEYQQWVEVEKPEEGAAVWMSKAGEPHHIGVWTGCGVLHALEGQGVVHETLTQIELMGWKIVRFEHHV